MRLITTWFLGLVFVAFPHRILGAEQPTQLHFKWQIGKRYVVSLETSTEIIMEGPPSNANKGGENEKSEFAISVFKTAQDAGCEVTVECLTKQLESGEGVKTYCFDSKTDPTRDVGIPIAARIRSFIGTRIKYLLDADYNVLRVEGTDELAAKTLAHDPTLKNDISYPLLKEVQFGTNALIELLQEFMVVGLPQKSLTVGGEWAHAKENAKDGTITDLKFTFKRSGKTRGA